MVFLKQRLNMFEWFLHFPANLRIHSNDKYLYNCVYVGIAGIALFIVLNFSWGEPTSLAQN